jgi:glycosyltransferase involved in cell wall biosynthesis
LSGSAQPGSAVARVALVCEPPDGGVAEHVAELALRLPERGHEVAVFVPRNFAPANRLAAAGCTVHALALRRDYRHPIDEIAATATLLRAVRRGGFALVHCHSAKAGVLGRAAARLAGLPAVYTPHCFPFFGDVSYRRRIFSRTVERTLASRTAAIVCVCEDERRVAVAAGLPPERLVVIYNGCRACDDGIAVDPNLLALRASGSLVGAVTVLRRDKALDVLVDAVPRLRRLVPGARVAIVGDGPELDSLQKRATQLGLADDAAVSFRPYAAPAARYLRALDVYVLPSTRDAFSIGLLEAQACGVPQVATDVGGAGEAVVAATGILVPARDPVRLADALATLLRDPSRRAAMSAASRARHAKHFTVERMVAETAALYDRILAPRR